MATAAPTPAMVDTLDQQLMKIVNELNNKEQLKKVILVAEAGAGIMWMTREISNRSHSEHGFVTIWVSLKPKYIEKALYETIATQLSLLPTEEEREDDDNDKKEKEGENNGVLDLRNLKDKISANLTNKKCLWILDGAGDNMNEAELEGLMQKLEDIIPSFSKFLITGTETRKRSDQTTESAEITDGTKMKIVAEPLSPDESWKLFLKIVGKYTISERFEELFKMIFKGDMCFPSAITMMAETVIYHLEHNPKDKKFEVVLEEIANKDGIDIAQLPHIAYDMLLNTIMIDCYWHSRQFFHNRSSVHYKELITYWILEGHLGAIDRIEKAYNKGHLVLMQLLKRGFLEKQKGNFVTLQDTMLKVDDQRLHGYGGTASLGLACAFEDGEWEGLGRITQGDGMVKSLCIDEKCEKISTLLLDRHRLSREVPDSFLHRLKGLKVLALFDSRLISLSFLSNLPKLLVFVLRGCPLIVKIDPVRELKSLTVLEISGARSLKNIPDDLFELMPDLRSVNLSGVPIESLPSSIFNRSKLRWLILRDCSELKEFAGLKDLENFEVLDLSGAACLKIIREKKLYLESPIKKLQMLDLSHSTIQKLPFLHQLHQLTRLLLSGCPNLLRLPRFIELYSLEVLDVSDSPALNEIQNETFEHLKKLRFLNLSKTQITQLPSLYNLSSLRQLLLNGCSLLEKVQKMDGLLGLEELNLSGCLSLREVPELASFEKLKVLDLSGCSDLKNLPDNSFERMSRLVKLNLSEMQIEALPPLPVSHNLIHLLLRNCKEIKKLPPLDSLLKLEELDLCGAISLKKIKAEFLENMVNLRHLDFSEIRQVEFPCMSKLGNLSHLSLRGCSGVKTVPNLKELVKIEVLDLSKTAVEDPSFLNSLSNLRGLSLKDCSNLQTLRPMESLGHLEKLDLSGTRIEEFPYDLFKSTHLKFIGLPNLQDTQVDWGKIKFLPEELNWDKSVINSFAEYLKQKRKYSMTVMGTKFFQLLKEVQELPISSVDTNLNQFHISVCSRNQSDEKDADHYNYCHIEEFREVDSWSGKVHCSDENISSLEIRGFDNFPAGVENVLRSAEYVSLIENSFSSSLSNLLTDKMKGCWVKRCNAMESILHAGDTHFSTGRNLEELWVSNMTKLKSLFSSKLQPKSFDNLKCLCLDCCPLLVNVFPASQAPENLEFLQIKFCDRVETVFEDECKLSTLGTLQLIELPQLKRIGGTFSELEVLEIRGCPKLKDELEEIIEVAKSLKTLSIANAVNLKNVYAGNSQSECFKELNYLSLESCPTLVNIFSRPHVDNIPQLLENLETIQIKFCDNLETFLEENAGAAVELPKLLELKLWKLPKFNSIIKSSTSLQTCNIKGCPALPQV